MKFRLPAALTGLIEQTRCQGGQRQGQYNRDVLKGSEGHVAGPMDPEQLALEVALEQSALDAAMHESRRMAGLEAHTSEASSHSPHSLPERETSARNPLLANHGAGGAVSEEELIQLAIRLSTAEAASPRPQPSPWTDYLNGGAMPTRHSSSDEALARALQQAEVDHAAVRGGQGASTNTSQTPGLHPPNTLVSPTAPALPPLISFSPPSRCAPAACPPNPAACPPYPAACPSYPAASRSPACPTWKGFWNPCPSGESPVHRGLPSPCQGVVSRARPQTDYPPGPAPGHSCSDAGPAGKARQGFGNPGHNPAGAPQRGYDPYDPCGSQEGVYASGVARPDTSADAAVAAELQKGVYASGVARSDTSADAAVAAKLQEELTREAAAPLPARAPVCGFGSTCGGCGRRLGFAGGGNCVSALGRMWHVGCFKCGACGTAIGSGTFVPRDDVPYHSRCHLDKFGPRCSVCKDHFPMQDGYYRFMKNRFWKDQKYCDAHNHDGTPSCCGCERLRPNGEAWVELADKRHICLACLDTVVVDTADAQPLYNQILNFFSRMAMPLPVKPPLVLVEVSALNEAEQREGRQTVDRAAPAFHTRGLTLMQEYREMRTVVRQRSGGRHWYEVVPDLVQVQGPSTYGVTAILVLHGLPWLLTGAILAHETMHAWLRLAGIPPLSADVEEGLCQLMALLWLESQPPAPEGMWEERLASYFAHQIRTHPSVVYGDGFRAALEAFQAHGLPSVLASVRATGGLPPVTEPRNL